MGNGFMEKLRIGRVRRMWISYHLDINYHVIYCDIDGARIREKIIQILNVNLIFNFDSIRKILRLFLNCIYFYANFKFQNLN